MRSNLSVAAYSTIIGLVARIPVEQARRLFLERIEAALPAKGAISSEQLNDAVNDALASFKPGKYVLDGDTWRERRPYHTLTLREMSEAYPAVLRGEPATDGDKRCWPPLPPREPSVQLGPPVGSSAKIDMTLAEASEAYARSLREDNEAAAEYRPVESKPITQLDLVEPDEHPKPFPVDPSPPPRVPAIYGTVEHEKPAPTDEELRQAMLERSDIDDDEEPAKSPMAVASRLSKKLKRNRRVGFGGSRKPPVFFR